MLRALLTLTFLTACVHHASIPTPLVRFQQATGGARWDRVRIITSDATVDVGGLHGTVHTVEDVATGRHRNDVDLTALRTADGFDGKDAWEQAPGGEVVITDSPDGLARARTDRWMTERGYFRAGGARYRALAVGGADFDVVEATPDGGAPIQLWFGKDRGLLARTVEREGTDTVVTTFDDYREVDGALLPFREVSDSGDPRSRATIVYTHIALADRVDDAAFARPATDAERLTFAGGARTTTLPFDLINNHIYIHATVDDQPVRLLVDTGGLNMLTPAAAKRLGLATSGKLAAQGVGAQKADLALAQAHALALGDVRLADPVFYVIDTGTLAQVEGEDFDGLVGFEVFSRLAVRIDYPGRALTLSRSEDLTPPPGAIAVPFTLHDRTPVVDGKVDGIAATFTIDTGARNSVTLASPFTRDHALVDKYKPRFETVTGWGVGGGVRAKPVRIGELALGGAVIHDVAGELFTGDAGAMADPDASGNLGGGVLRRFVVTFDYPRRTMYLEPAANPPPRDVYDRAGMFLIADGDALKVIAVTPGGAAEAAGLKEGDRIATIDGTAVATRHLADWRAILAAGAVGERHVLGRAGGGTVTLVLTELLP